MPGRRNYVRLTRYERVAMLIRFMRVRPVEDNTFTKLARELDMPYSSIRETIKNHYPHCFEELPNIGWRITGAQPEPDIPFDFNRPPFPEDKTPPVPASDTARSGTRRGWTYSQEALRYLDTLWPGESFAEVLTKAHSKNKLDELVIIGKTMARAAQDMKTYNGKVPF